MIALKIIGVLVAIITLIMLVPVGADICYEDGRFSFSAKVCGTLFQLFPKHPADESKPRKKKKTKNEKKPQKDKTAKEKPTKEKKKLNFSKDEILCLVKKVLKKFGRFGRKFKVDRFLLHYTGGGKDPYDVAVSFAYINAALSSLAPICSKRFDVKDCEVRTDCNFTLEKPKIDFGLAFTIRIGAFFVLAFGVAFSALGLLIRNKLRLFMERQRNRKNKQPGTPAGNNMDLIEENTEPEERNDSNG